MKTNRRMKHKKGCIAFRSDYYLQQKIGNGRLIKLYDKTSLMVRASNESLVGTRRRGVASIEAALSLVNGMD